MKKSKLILFLFFAFLAFLNLTGSVSSQSTNPEVHLIELRDDSINPITSEYIVSSIEHSEEMGAECLIIKLDTPGGLLNSTRTIVKRILSSKVPIVVYIAPSGSHAGSAGVFISYASHLVAMAPSTNIGAAHPVQMKQGGEKTEYWDELKDLIKKAQKQNDQTSQSEEKTENGKDVIPDNNPLSSKILQDTVAFIKALAFERNRNVDWAIKSVTKSSSITENEALTLKVIDVIANSDQDLLQKIDGRTVKLNGIEKTLHTKNAIIKQFPMDLRQRLFNILANPNIAYILMILGFYGLLYEVTHPGIGVPGVLGAIFLILAFFSMQALPTNYAGLALFILGIILFITEAFIPGIGLPTLGGIVCVFLGSLLLFPTADPVMQLSKKLIFGFTALNAAIFVSVISAVIRVHRSRVTTGESGLIGQVGKARADFQKENEAYEGKISIYGEIWSAVSSHEIKKGQEVKILEVNGMHLTVTTR